jgi:integrase
MPAKEVAALLGPRHSATPQIKTVTLKSGEKRYEFTHDAGRHPVTGRRRQTTRRFKTLKEAKAELARTGHEVQTGTFTPRWDGTVDEVLNNWLASACFERAAATKASYHGIVRIPRERLGQRKARSITRQDIEKLRGWTLAEGRKCGGKRGTPLSARSAALMLSTLNAAFTQAERDGLIARNPCRYVKLPRQEKAQRVTLSEDEMSRLLKTADADRLAACWRLTLLGMRRSEVLYLKWSGVSFADKTITIAGARVLVSGTGVIEKDTKSARGTRVLPVDDDTVAALRALRQRQREERLAAGEAYTDTGHVAADELGQPVHPERYSDEFTQLCADAGVPKIRLHDARHTANSLMAAAGIPDHIRASWCGHTVAVNVATYTHARPEDLAMARDALSAIYSAL